LFCGSSRKLAQTKRERKLNLFRIVIPFSRGFYVKILVRQSVTRVSSYLLLLNFIVIV